MLGCERMEMCVQKWSCVVVDVLFAILSLLCTTFSHGLFCVNLYLPTTNLFTTYLLLCGGLVPTTSEQRNGRGNKGRGKRRGVLWRVCVCLCLFLRCGKEPFRRCEKVPDREISRQIRPEFFRAIFELACLLYPGQVLAYKCSQIVESCVEGRWARAITQQRRIRCERTY